MTCNTLQLMLSFGDEEVDTEITFDMFMQFLENNPQYLKGYDHKKEWHNMCNPPWYAYGWVIKGAMRDWLNVLNNA